MSALERSINPCIFLLVIFCRYLTFPFFYIFFRISFSMISSCFIVCLVVGVVNLIVLIRIQPSYDFPKSAVLRLYLLKQFLLSFS